MHMCKGVAEWRHRLPYQLSFKRPELPCMLSFVIDKP